MWVVKTAGETYYVQHVECKVPWSTKETPDNSHTKGSIKIKDCLLAIDDDNCASIDVLTEFDRARIRNQKRGISRVMFSSVVFERALKDEKIKHSPFKRVYGACGTAFTVCDLLDKNQTLILSLKYPKEFRILMPNEKYYQAYDDQENWKELQHSYDAAVYADYEDEDED